MVASEDVQNDIREAYLTTMRQRFKMEINRLSRRDMRLMLLKTSLSDGEVDQLRFFMTYLYAWHWLQQNVHSDHQPDVLSAFAKGPQGFLMLMLQRSNSAAAFIQAYIDHWEKHRDPPHLQQQHLLQLLKDKGNRRALAAFIQATWDSLHLFKKSLAAEYRDLAKQEKYRYRNMLGAEDRERLALVDRLPDSGPLRPFSKLGVVPAMGCPQSCRHCMFIFRPLVKSTTHPSALYRMLNELTTSVLFTGGDLSRYLNHFYEAIKSMHMVTTFGILLNGDFADSREMARQVLSEMSAAVRQRPMTAPNARIILQISFDEFHQEVVVDRNGDLNERIPVAKIANIVEAAPQFEDVIQLCLLHKQGYLNFSMNFFQQGVFARLVRELGRRGHQVQVLSSAPSSRLKQNPLNPEKPAALIKDAIFVLTDYPDVRFLLTSSTVDAYGRASMMAFHEAVNERNLLEQMLAGKGTGGESFDKELMFWFNGWATLFSAVHVCLGNVFEDGMDTILKRQQKDPLSNALNRFDLRLLDYYRELNGDLDEIIDRSTSPHHLFRRITEDSATRLHMTKRLIESGFV